MTSYSSLLYRHPATWPNPSKELKESLTQEVDRKIDSIASGIANNPGIDARMAAQQVKAKLTESITRQSRHAFQLTAVERLKNQWIECQTLTASLQRSLNSLKGTSSVDSDIKKEEDVFLQREVAIASQKRVFEVQAKAGSALGPHSVEITQLATGAEWSTDDLNISEYAPIVKNNCSGSSPCITAGSLEIEKRNNRMVSSVRAATKDEDVTSLTDTNKFGIGTFYFNDSKVEIEQGDSLTKIANKINQYQKDVTASVEFDKAASKYKLVLASEKLGVENEPQIKEVGNAIFQNRMTPEPEYIVIKLTNGMNLKSVIGNINSYSAEHGVIAAFVNKKLTLHSTVTGVGNDIELKNENAIFGNLFEDNLGVRRKNIIEQDAMMFFDGTLQTSKKNEMNVKFAGGEIFFNLYETNQGEKQTVTVRASQNAVTKAVDEFLVNYYKLLSFLANREAEKKIDGAALNNLPASIKFDDFSKAMGIDNIQGKSLFEAVGINFREDKLSAFADKNSGYIRSANEIANNLIFFDEVKFKDSLDKDFEKVKNLFVYNANGSKNLYPYPTKQNGIQYNTIDSIDLDINKDRAAFQTTLSKQIANSKKFESGTFFLNNQFINIKKGQDIDALVRQINEVQEESGIKAKVIPDGPGYRVSLEKIANFSKIYDPMVKWPPILADYDNILDGIFKIEPESYSSVDFADVNASVTNPADDHTNTNLFTNGTFFINSTPIAVMENDTLQNIHDKINDANAGVRAEIITENSQHKLKITASTEANIKINDPDQVLNNIFTKTFEDRGERFFDVTKITEFNIRRFDEDNIKKALYIPKNLTNLGQDADILALDWPSDKEVLEANSLKLMYFGDGYENTKLKISQGLADKFYNVLDGYLSFNGFIENAEKERAKLEKEEKDEIQRIEEEEIKKIILNIKKELSQIASIQAKGKHISSIFSRNNQ